jgi:hypothetical protein
VRRGRGVKLVKLLKIEKSNTPARLVVRNVFIMEGPLRHQNLYRIFTPTEDDLSVVRGYLS